MDNSNFDKLARRTLEYLLFQKLLETTDILKGIPEHPVGNAVIQ